MGLARIHVGHGQRSTRLSLIGDNINICWSPDGNNIAVGNKDDLVTFIDARTWKPFADEQFKFEVNLRRRSKMMTMEMTIYYDHDGANDDVITSNYYVTTSTFDNDCVNDYLCR